jgi:D-alanyl-D-alanine carboxypeptidase/D-alanyl-D-alanine-endopeptidase (penicillin-binding protein 4)
MNFCAKCGRERSGDARYCGGCGTELPAASAAAATPPTGDPAGGDPQPSATVEAQAGAAPAGEPERWDQPAEPTGWELPTPASDDWSQPADATRVERQPDVTMIDRPGSADSARAATPAAAAPDPFAAWFAPDGRAAPRTEPGGQWQAAEPWQAADTVYAGSGQAAAAYPPSSQPAPGYPPPRPPYGSQPGPPPGGRRSSGGRKAAFTLVVVLVMLAAGGGAYALVSRSSKQNTTQPPASPTAASSAGPTAQSSASTSASPTGGGSPSAAASASAPSGLVSVAAGVASNGAEPAVQTTLGRYFQGINDHNYAEYQSAHNAQEQATEPKSAFGTGYGSTEDSGMTLVALQSTADGGESATVTFTSRQAAAASIDGSACNNWRVTYFLVPHGAGYLIGPAPAGYKPTYSDC